VLLIAIVAIVTAFVIATRNANHRHQERMANIKKDFITNIYGQ
jgi:predicted nucleic acid-binding protein